MAKTSSVTPDPGYAGLTESADGLPAAYYFDPAHHATEMSRIWQKSWIYACRSEEVRSPRSYKTYDIGDQSILLVRDELGVLRGFHNTCRHRGAALCREPQGRIAAAGIVCPYHNWRYSTRGELLQTSSYQHAEGFSLE